MNLAIPLCVHVLLSQTVLHLLNHGQPGEVHSTESYQRLRQEVYMLEYPTARVAVQYNHAWHGDKTNATMLSPYTAPPLTSVLSAFSPHPVLSRLAELFISCVANANIIKLHAPAWGGRGGRGGGGGGDTNGINSSVDQLVV